MKGTIRTESLNWKLMSAILTLLGEQTDPDGGKSRTKTTFKNPSYLYRVQYRLSTISTLLHLQWNLSTRNLKI